MDPNAFPTKGNLMLAKNTLQLSKQGYELMDKKRNILIRELMNLIDRAKAIQTQIDSTFTEAYKALQRANLEMGVNDVSKISYAIPKEKSVQIKIRSIMGVEIPLVSSETVHPGLSYGFAGTSTSLDDAYGKFIEVKKLTIELAMVENSAYRLATNIKKTQKRANALKNITIPMYTNRVHMISNELEEKEREEFTRLKVIKRRK